jgi:3-phosphoglycerate kinase
MPIRSIKQIKNLKGKRVLARVDFNVPVKKGKVADDFKIQKTLPTITYLMSRGAKIILVSHLGRPKGFDIKFSLRPVARHLEKILKIPIKFLKIKRLEDWKIIRLRIWRVANTIF